MDLDLVWNADRQRYHQVINLTNFQRWIGISQLDAQAGNVEFLQAASHTDIRLTTSVRNFQWSMIVRTRNVTLAELATLAQDYGRRLSQCAAGLVTRRGGVTSLWFEFPEVASLDNEGSTYIGRTRSLTIQGLDWDPVLQVYTEKADRRLLNTVWQK